MYKKITFLVSCLMFSSPLFAQDIYRGQVLGDSSQNVPGDIYRGTTFGEKQKSYPSDTLGNRALATKKYVYDTSLMRAVKIDDPDRVRTLIYTNVDTNERNYAGITPLTVAAERGHVDIISLLVEKGKADVNLTSSYGITPLIAASAAGQTAAAKYLLDHGANSAVRDNTGKTALLYSLLNDTPDLTAVLSKGGEVSVNLPDPSGNSPLMIASQKGFVKQVKSLLAGGAHVDYRNPASGLSALAAAAAEDHSDVIRALARNGHATLDLPDLNGRTPLMYAVEQEKHDALRTLIILKANTNEQDTDGTTPLMRAAAKNDTQSIALLFKDKFLQPELKDFQGRTALHYSAFATDPQAAELLLTHQADIDDTDWAGNTPLLTAIQAKNDRLALFFIQQGADLTIVNKQGLNPLTMATLAMPDSMTAQVLQVKQQEIQQQALQEQAAQLARVRELEEQLAAEEAHAKNLLDIQQQQLEQQRWQEQARTQQVYEEDLGLQEFEESPAL